MFGAWRAPPPGAWSFTMSLQHGPDPARNTRISPAENVSLQRAAYFAVPPPQSERFMRRQSRNVDWIQSDGGTFAKVTKWARPGFTRLRIFEFPIRLISPDIGASSQHV
jgi:hypothetical protein